MLISFLRTIILYFLTVIALRIMGKRQVGQLEPIELVITLMISELASIPMGHVSIPLIHGVIPILTLIIAEATLSFINLKSRRLRKFSSGAPVILIKSGKVNEKELARLRMNIDDLMEELRANGNIDISEIEYAIFETNGSVSVIKKDKNIAFPFLLVCDGRINKNALDILQKDKKWLENRMQEQNIFNIQDVFYAGINSFGDVYFQAKEKE